MSSKYLDKLIEYMTIKSQRHFNIENINYGAFNNLTNPGIVFAYKTYQNKEGVPYSANIYYWYYLCLTVL